MSGHELNCAASALEVDDLDLESEGGVRGDDTTGTGGTVSVIGRAGKDGLLTLLELADALIPASDDLADADDELERLAARDGGVKDLTVGKLAGVVDLDPAASGDDGTSSLVELLNSE